MQTRIWLQTGNAMEGKAPSLWDPFQKGLVAHVKEVARPDTIIDVHGTQGASPTGIDRFVSSKQILAQWFVKNAVRAEKEGYDAWACVNFLDPGFYEIRELVNIPVLFMVETSLHLACLLAPKFAIIGHNEAIFLRLTQMAEQYGLGEHMVPGGHVDLKYAQLYPMFKNPQPGIDLLVKTGREVIQRGANILLLAANPLNMLAQVNGLKEIDGVPILDACGAMVKAAEFMVDLKRIGITRGNKGLYGVPSKDELVAIRKLYGLE